MQKIGSVKTCFRVASILASKMTCFRIILEEKNAGVVSSYQKYQGYSLFWCR